MAKTPSQRQTNADDAAADAVDATTKDAGSTPALDPGIAQLSYEEARDDLIETVRTLEQGGLTLEESLQLWERGEQLGRRCEELLAGAHQRIEDALSATNEDED